MNRLYNPEILKETSEYPCEIEVMEAHGITYPYFETRDDHQAWLNNYRAENGKDPMDFSILHDKDDHDTDGYIESVPMEVVEEKSTPIVEELKEIEEENALEELGFKDVFAEDED